MKNRKSILRRCNHRWGTTSVEMALVLPVFLSVVFGCMEFSRLGMIRSRISNAAYEGARFAMVQGGTAADAQQAVANSLNVLGVVSPTTTVQFLDETDTQVTPGQATRVNVQVDVPYAPNSFSLGLLPDSISQLQLSAQVTLRTNLQNAE